MCSGSLEVSINSGTEVCMRYAISACRMRVRISGSPTARDAPVQRLARSSIRRRRLAVMPSGLDRYSTGSPRRAKLHP
ncbi:MAG: hypothetical protein Ct9H300mP7_1890 [Verrucomicrobiota bacterium]|nr:MAG: hypothetical protein Ct9H300mP7_1890 [Verrucomicrobiota bacterium]